jgi:CubicO group peptidase (beta-lactamase class C family)
MKKMKTAAYLMEKAVADQVFPGGVLLVSKAEQIVFFEAFGYANPAAGREMTKETFFDLASLTKPLATTLAVMKLVHQSRLKLSQTIETILPPFKNTAKGKISIAHLLCHNSGLPAYQPYYQTLCDMPFAVRCDALRKMIVAEPLLFPVGQTVEYSDIGFMLLRWVIEAVTGLRLDYFLERDVFSPLEIHHLFFMFRDKKIKNERFAATEQCPWRNILLEGQVHDDNAFVVGGVEGHAGLFGSAAEIHRLLRLFLDAYHGRLETAVFSKKLVKRFFQPQGQTNRTLGFDKPALKSSASGAHFSEHSIGHLGFTGTSFWMDLKRSIIIILLTNRVYFTRRNDQINAFRPLLHDRVMVDLI